MKMWTIISFESAKEKEIRQQNKKLVFTCTATLSMWGTGENLNLQKSRKFNTSMNKVISLRDKIDNHVLIQLRSEVVVLVYEYTNTRIALPCDYRNTRNFTEG